MRFVDDDIRRIFHCGTLVVLPSFWIRSQHIQDSRTRTIDVRRFRKDTRRLCVPLSVLERANGVELACQICFYGCTPEILRILAQCDRLEVRSLRIVVEAHLHLLGSI